MGDNGSHPFDEKFECDAPRYLSLDKVDAGDLNITGDSWFDRSGKDDSRRGMNATKDDIFQEPQPSMLDSPLPSATSTPAIASASNGQIPPEDLATSPMTYKFNEHSCSKTVVKSSMTNMEAADLFHMSPPPYHGDYPSIVVTTAGYLATQVEKFDAFVQMDSTNVAAKECSQSQMKLAVAPRSPSTGRSPVKTISSPLLPQSSDVALPQILDLTVPSYPSAGEEESGRHSEAAFLQAHKQVGHLCKLPSTVVESRIAQHVANESMELQTAESVVMPSESETPPPFAAAVISLPVCNGIQPSAVITGAASVQSSESVTTRRTKDSVVQLPQQDEPNMSQVEPSQHQEHKPSESMNAAATTSKKRGANPSGSGGGGRQIPVMPLTFPITQEEHQPNESMNATATTATLPPTTSTKRGKNPSGGGSRQPAVIPLTLPSTPKFNNKKREPMKATVVPKALQTTPQQQAANGHVEPKAGGAQPLRQRSNSMMSNASSTSTYVVDTKKPPIRPPTPTRTSLLRKRAASEERIVNAQLEMHKEAEAQKTFEFRAAAVPRKILESPTGIPAKSEQVSITIPMDIAFATDARLAARAAAKAVKGKETETNEATESDQVEIKKRRISHVVPKFDNPFVPKLDHKTTLPAPFSFQQAVDAYPQKMKQLREGGGETVTPHAKAHEFLAKPFDKESLATGVGLPAKQVIPNVVPEPFKFSTDARGEEYQRKLKEKVEREEAERIKLRNFKAHRPTVLEAAPFQPMRAEHKPIDVEGFELHTEQRAKERAEFEAERKRVLMAKVAEREAAEAAKAAEEAETKRRRKEETAAKATRDTNVSDASSSSTQAANQPNGVQGHK